MCFYLLNDMPFFLKKKHEDLWVKKWGLKCVLCFEIISRVVSIRDLQVRRVNDHLQPLMIIAARRLNLGRKSHASCVIAVMLGAR